jgi:hypothetical protein
MAIRESALLLLACSFSTCLADSQSPFNGSLVAVVVVVALLLSAIVATAVALLIIWIRWQRSEGESSSDERVNLESQPRSRGFDFDDKEEEEESQLKEPVTQQKPEAPVYSVVHKPPVRHADSITSDGEENTYHDVSMGVGAAAETNHYDDTMQLKPTRHAPLAPQEPSKEKEQVSDKKPAYENIAKPSRRAPPPRPVIVGEETHTATFFSPTYEKPGEEKEKTIPQLPQVSPAAVKLRPAPPAKPKSTEPPTQPAKPQSSGPPAPPIKPQSSGPPAPPIKPQSSGPPAPPTKPQSSGPPAPPAKPQSSGPPAPPAKPQSSGPPAPPNKPKFTGPPTKPQASATAPTKPKPQVQLKPAGIANDSGTPSSPSKTPKPKVKPRVPAKPFAADGEFEQDSSVPIPVGKFGEHVASMHADGNTGFSREFNSLPMGEFGRAIFDAIMPLHACRNRHANIIPYNDNRPKLEPIPGNKDCQHDYINASFIDGVSTHHRYIAAQGMYSIVHVPLIMCQCPVP